MPYLGRTVVTNLADFHVDNYASGGGFTAGSTTQLTLTVAGIDDEEALSIFFDGVHQHHNTYTIASSVVTFDTAIPTGTANVEIHYGKQPVASALAANSIDSEHYVDGSIDLAHMSSQSVDEDNLHISNAGSNGQFLSKQSGDAGGLTWATPASGFTQAAQQATTSGTAKDFTGIPAGVKMIVVGFSDVSLDSTDELLIQLGDAGGFETSGYLDKSGRIGVGGYVTGAGFLLKAASASEISSGQMILTLQDAATYHWSSQHGFASDYAVAGGGRKLLSAELTQVRFTVDGSGDFDAGSVSLMYM